MSSLRLELSNVYRGKRIFITGHTGFKGAWLAEWLLQLGAEVHGYALAPGKKPVLFEQLDLASRLHHQAGDIRNFQLLRDSIISFQPDFVFHLAAQPLVRYGYQEPLETYETNVMGTLHVLEVMRELKKQSSRRIAGVMVTTDKCYENHEDATAYHEEDRLGGHDPYSSSKAMAEISVAAYRRSYFSKNLSSKSTDAANNCVVPVLASSSINDTLSRCASATPCSSQASVTLKTSSHDSSVHVATARAGNVIGGGDWAEDRILPDAIRALEREEPILVRNPHSVRPWQHVLEPLCGYLMLGARLMENHQCAGAFNFGPPAEEKYSVADVVNEVLKHWSGSWQDVSNPTEPHEARHLNLSIKKAIEILGWRPVWNFEKTIAQTMAWYRSYYYDPKSIRRLTEQQIKVYEMEASLVETLLFKR